MRLIPGRTKVKIELFKGVTLADVGVGLVGLCAVTLCVISTIPHRWIVALIIALIFAFLIFRIDEEPIYVFIWHMLRFTAYPKRFNRMYTDKALLQMSNPELSEDFFEEEVLDVGQEEEKLDKKELKKIIKEENKILKSKDSTQEEKDAVWQARAARSAEKKKEKAEAKENEADFEYSDEIMPFTDIKDGFIDYDGKYYGAAIEIDPIEFRFFSKYRRNNSIENCFGKVLRSFKGDYGANIVKIQRPIIYDEYLDSEYEKLDALKKSYESGLLSEEELQARVEIQYERINEVRALCEDEKVIEPFYYLVLFDSEKRRLDIAVKQAVLELERGELVVRRLDTKGLALFLKYTNCLDFDEKEIDRISPEHYAKWAMPESLRFSMRRIVTDGIITHNMRVINYPSVVGDSWLAGVMSFPSTKVVVKLTPTDSTKAIRAIDYSLAELRGQYMNTSIDSKLIEIQEHIDTLSTLLVTLKQDNETLLSTNIYVTAYDGVATRDDPVLSEGFGDSLIPMVADIKRTVRRSYSEAGLKLSGMDFMQIQAYIGGQISAYDPLIKEARGIPSNTVAGMFPWIFAHISDKGGIKLGQSDGVPVFIDFFRRDSERVNSNMVIVGKSGSGKSYATKSLLSNLASEDAKIFILDPENEYSELAKNLHGKVINVGNAKYGRLNPFHIITALDDDEAGTEGGGPGGSYATHLQFLEEFFRQILPDIDKDALEYLNSLVERVYLDFGITPETDLSNLTAGDYPIFDDLYDVVLAEFERTNNEYLRQLLRSLVNYIAKFSTGGRNANIWNGPSTITTDENFSVFNFQSMLANRNTTIANAQMLLVLKYIDNEIIKNRDYNLKYGLNRKIVVVIDEAHVFIDNKFPVALDFMFQLAKRIRKYNGMQIVITQNIKDFVGSEEIARKSSAIINACQYSFVFGLSPNDMDDLCKLYQKAGGINEREQEDILAAKRGQAFTIMSPTSRSSFMVEVPDTMVDMFSNPDFVTNYFYGEDGEETWNEFIGESRALHDANVNERIANEASGIVEKEELSGFLNFSEISEDEAEEIKASQEERELEAQAKKSAMEKLIAAEETVDRREYEMAMGRFGGISFSETTEPVQSGGISFSEVSEDQISTGGISFSEISEEEAMDMENASSNVQPVTPSVSMAATPVTPVQPVIPAATYAAPQVAAPTQDAGYSQAFIEETLSEFKDSMREQMAKELEDKLKWISLGAQAAGRPIEDTAEEEEKRKRRAYIDEDTEEEDYKSEEYDEDEDDDFDFGSDEDEKDEDDFDFESDEDEKDEDDYDEDYDSDEDEDEDEDDDDDFGFDSFDDDDDELSFEDDSEEYEPAPFIFAELLNEAAEEYANMDLMERLDELGESVMEITLEELASYVKEQRKKKANG
ncbi:MAG: DUF87 domain-containing protein [Lachnospiraceae bacterium]|nr:DUF87 domain-containing protein [Lachnospiraceae bacterium]